MSYKSINNCERKKVFLRKQFSKFRASDNSNLQIKQSLQNNTTDHNNYTYIKTILFTQIYLFVTISIPLSSKFLVKVSSISFTLVVPYIGFKQQSSSCISPLLQYLATTAKRGLLSFISMHSHELR